MGSACSSKTAVQVRPADDVVPSAPHQPASGAPPIQSSHQATRAMSDPAGGSQRPAQKDIEVVPQAKPKAKPMSLIKAIKANDLAVVEELLQSPDCNMEALGMWDNTPLLAACMYGHSEVALRLIARGADVFARNEHGATPLHYASVEGCLDVTAALLEAAPTGEAERLVNCGMVKVYNRHLDAYGERTPLASAAESGFQGVAELLLTHGAKADEADEDGRTPLWLAARHGKSGAAKLLLAHGVDISHRDKDGVSVLGAATSGTCNEELVLALLAQGLDVNKTAGSPLRDAVKSNKKGVVESLLTHGANVNSTSSGATALHAACERGDEYLVHLLVRSRADPSINDESGATAFDLLRRRGLPDGKIVAMLSPPTSDDDGGTGSAASGQG
ncbi:unnamed protein product [Effrenium voratum]|nr:unnamed protein product [Effrenium voratum]